MEELIEIDSENWKSLVDEISEGYSNGELISHELLKSKFGMKKLCVEDFETIDEFVYGLQLQQFHYMTLTDKLKECLLENKKCCIRNVWGEGYSVVQPSEQVKFGVDMLIKNIKKNIRDCKEIVDNTKKVSMEQQAKDNTLRAKFYTISQVMKGLA